MAGTALVLGGGGVTGVAWEFGVLAGLAEAGVDLTTAELIVGTSAGSVVAAQITADLTLDALYERQLDGFGSEVRTKMGVGTILKLAWAVVGSRDPQKGRARVGKMAIAARTPTEAERRAIIAARLPRHEWPDRRMLITAVAADDGEFVAFDRESGVSLVDAVGASCAVPGVWPAVSINGRRYVDGGMRSPANVDLATGFDRVVVLAPIASGIRRGTGVAAQVAALPKGTRTIVVTPDQPAKAAIGRNVLDPARRAPAARAGRRQADDLIKKVASTWSD